MEVSAAWRGSDGDGVIGTTVAGGGAVAGGGGILWGLMFRSVTHMTGFLPGVKAFTAAVVGGIGNLGGAMAGGISLGSAESIAPMVILEPLGVPGVSQLKDAVAFTVLVLVLLFKPSGLYGHRRSLHLCSLLHRHSGQRDRPVSQQTQNPPHTLRVNMEGSHPPFFFFVT